MRKTTLLFLISLTLSLCCLCFLVPAKAQKGQGGKRPSASAQRVDNLKAVPSMVKVAKEAGSSFNKRALFASSAPAAADSPVREALLTASLYDLDKATTAALLQEQPQTLSLPLPDGDGGTLELELVKVEIFAPGFKVSTLKPGAKSSTLTSSSSNVPPPPSGRGRVSVWDCSCKSVAVAALSNS